MVSLVDAAPSIRVSTFFPGRAPIPTWVSACLIFVASSRVRACVIRAEQAGQHLPTTVGAVVGEGEQGEAEPILERRSRVLPLAVSRHERGVQDRKSTRLNSSHVASSYAVFCLKKKTKWQKIT